MSYHITSLQQTDYLHARRPAIRAHTHFPECDRCGGETRVGLPHAEAGLSAAPAPLPPPSHLGGRGRTTNSPPSPFGGEARQHHVLPCGLGDYSGRGAKHMFPPARSCSPPQEGSRRGWRPSPPRYALGSQICRTPSSNIRSDPPIPPLDKGRLGAGGGYMLLRSGHQY